MQKFRQIYCVEKTTLFERIKNNPKHNRIKDDLTNRVRQNHNNHCDFMEVFKKKLKDQFPKATILKDEQLDKIKTTEEDLIITCGGDGSFLNCAQKFRDSFLLGVNTNYLPNDLIFGSLGALTTINKKNLERKWKAFCKGNYSTQKWQRLAAKINGKKVNQYSVNDIFIGSPRSYLTCYFSLETNSHQSEFFCSGILTCTGTGSNAWYRNAGGSPFDKNLNAFSYLVLSPQAKTPPSCISEILSDSNKLILRVLKDQVILCFDSRKEIKTFINDEIEIFLDENKPIKVIIL